MEWTLAFIKYQVKTFQRYSWWIIRTYLFSFTSCAFPLGKVWTCKVKEWEMILDICQKCLEILRQLFPGCESCLVLQLQATAYLRLYLGKSPLNRSITLAFVVKWWFNIKFTLCFCLQEFIANQDSDTVVFQQIHPSIEARYIRLLPTKWHKHISMRMELYGCEGTIATGCPLK